MSEKNMEMMKKLLEKKKEQSSGKEEKLYQKIGQLQIEIDFLKKNLGMLEE